jgi:C1A family cysteine protease
MKKIFAAFLAVSMVSTLLPTNVLLFQGTSVTKAAGITTAEECTTLTSDRGDIGQVYSIVNDGKASSYGLQQTKVVDEQGKAVDFEEMQGVANALGDGTVLETVEGILTSSTSSSLKNASKVASRKGGSVVESSSKFTSSSVASNVRNQGTWGLCWTFSSTSAMEANIIKNASSFTTSTYTKDTIDLSERHLGWFAHNTYSTDKTDLAYGDGAKKTTPSKAYVGGNASQVAAYLARGCGMAQESEAKYDTTSAMQGLEESDRYSSSVMLKDWIDAGGYSKDEASIKTAVASIKSLIETYGAVDVSYASYDSYYKENANGDGRMSYYSDKTSVNHGVTIVGWDDNYSADNFNLQPAGDGAWLVRNSWGSSWSGDGYFWMSYYEKSLTSISAYNMMDAGKYGRTYCYTGAGKQASISRGSVDASAANVYLCQEDETLKSVGVYTTSNNQTVKVTVYVSDEKMTVPTDGNAKSTLTVNDTGIEGFHVLDLSTTVSLKKGQYFSVLVTYSNSDGTTAMIPIESTSGTKSLTGQTFYLTLTSSGTAWVDSNDKSMNGKGNVNNACIYAYTSDTDNADLKTSLSALITEGKALQKDVVTSLAGADTWSNIQTELSSATNILNNGQAALLKKEIRTLGRIISFSSSKNLYGDAKYTTGAGAGGISLYQNGGTVKINGVSTNYKGRTLYVDMEKGDSYVRTSKKSSTYKVIKRGNYVAAVTSTLTKPTLGTDGKVTSSDEAAEKIAKAKISGSKVTLSALAPGDVYVWVLYYPKSDILQEQMLEKQTDFAVTKVHVGVAPQAVRAYESADADVRSSQVQYLSDNVPAGQSVSLYVKGTTGSITKKADTLQEVKADDITYYATVPTKYQDGVTVTQDSQDASKFTISVSSDFLTKYNVKSGKTLAVTIPFICSKNGKKVNFKAVVSNSVKTMAFSGVDTDADKVSSSNGTVSVKLPSALKAATQAILEETTQLYVSDLKVTDPTKFYSLGTENGFTLSKTSTITVADKPSTAQKKVTIAAVKGKAGQYVIKAAKGTPDGTKAYLMVWHNSYQGNRGKAYQVIQVTVGE